MSAGWHIDSLLGAYVLGVLERDEVGTVEDHLASCAECRMRRTELQSINERLGEVPPEAFVDGPPPGGDLLLRRTLRAVRGERAVTGRRRVALVAAGVAAVVAAALGAGVVVGRQSAPTTGAVGPAPSTAATQTHSRSGTDPATGATMTVALTPAVGWVRLHAKVAGVAAGRRCQLVVVSRGGAQVVAGGWLVSAKGQRDGTTLDGSALVAPGDIVSVDVVTLDGQRLVSVPL
jgi:hypothetical protein